MGYKRQGFVNFDKNHPLTAEQLIAMEDGILGGASLEIENTEETVLKAGDSVETYAAYVSPSQTVGSAIQWGSHSSSYKFVIPANAVVWMEPVTGGSYGFALCDENNLVLDYTTNSASYTFKSFDKETYLWASAPKLGTTKYTITTQKSVSMKDHEDRLNQLDKMVTAGGNFWTGKTLWWCGTSIPAGGYPQIVGEMLGAECINTAVGGSMCRANVRTGDYNGANISNITSSLSMTLEEAEAFIANYDTLRQLSGNSSWPETLGSSNESRIRAGSFENKLMPYLDGTKPMPDLWILDHSHNDRKYKLSDGSIDIGLEPTRANIDSGELAEDTYMTANNYENLIKYVGSLDNIDPSKLDSFVCSLNRNCYYGALNFICTVILHHNPRARIFMISNYSNEYVGETSYADLIEVQRKWAREWGFPYFDISTSFGASAVHIIPGTKDYASGDHSATFTYDIPLFKIYCPDGVHPSSDNSLHSMNVYAGLLSEFIKTHR